MSRRSSRFHVNESDLMCKNHCGFYGNTTWKGYCSVCYKARSNRSQTSHSKDVLARSSVGSTRPISRPSLKPEQSFAKFEEKRRQQSERISGTVKSLFSKTAKKDKAEADKSTHVKKDLKQRSLRSNRFGEFLQNLGPHIYENISKKVQLFVAKFQMIPPNSTVEVCSEEVQDFYQMINDHMNTDPVYQSLDEKIINELLDQLENYLMSRLYNAVFCPANSEDEQQDLNLQKRIRSLHWVTIQQLEANVNEQDLGVRSALDKAIADLTELDTKSSPKDKMACIVDCSRKIFNALRLSSIRAAEVNGGTVSVASADDFLPVFIFIILNANPPRLKSNINYITRFAFPSRLNSGECGYFFTNMCCVVEFIEKLNAESLNLSEEDFNSYMSGEAIPEGTNTVYMCDGLRLIHENCEQIKKLKQRQEKCQSNVEKLEQRLMDFKKEFDEQINDLIIKTPLVMKARKEKADLDAVSDIPTSLPSPILPQQAQ